MLNWTLTRMPRMALAGLVALLALPGNLAANGLGQPAPKQMGLQEAATPIAHELHAFYNLTNTIIIAIALFVLILMIYVMVRFNEKKNPTPSTTTHHTLLEVAWTVVPILVLVVIAIPSFKLLMNQYTYPKPDLTIKAIANSWFWEHEYPDQGNFNITSNMLTDEEVAEREAKGIPSPRLLSVDNEIVVPVNKVVHMLVTSNDVIHNWTVPSFASKVDAVPGRITSTWFQAQKEGIFYGQCSELCGLNHAFMPIGVRVVSEQVFNEWAGAMQAKDRKKAREILDKVALEQAGVRTVAESAASGTR
ncbi:cytochrome c oxidase subunit II [Hyphomicrobium sp. CS1GBMeth3]|uniref:cytochrome c oxidase subunit II n=1 Tax=Hyphomicrobium sp. CS1GBMeth3 TaxID=1892845 RepID=UPI00093078A2|nr:cytochrome c oxidase subunit II [Hyphomicrobium sp. CS1GBMeth3]